MKKIAKWVRVELLKLANLVKGLPREKGEEDNRSLGLQDTHHYIY